MPKRGRGGGGGQLENPWSQGERGRCLKDKSAGLSTGAVAHDEELEKVNSPGYLELSCKEDVHRINP